METGHGRCTESRLGCNTLKVGLANCFSLRNKVYSVMEMMIENSLEVLALTETWLNEDEAALAVELGELGYTLVNAARTGKKGGGVGFVLRDRVKFTRCKSSTRSFECLEIFVKGSVGIRFAVVYRTGQNHSQFISEFGDYLASFVSKGGVPMVLGDFNVRFQDSSDRFTEKFKSLIKSEGWSQHVVGPTHIKGGTLDLVLTRDGERVGLSGISSYRSPVLPDHSLISFFVDVSGYSSSSEFRIVRNRKMAGLDMDDLKADVLQSDLCGNLPGDLDHSVQLYNSLLLGFIDSRAPVVTRNVRARNDQWFTQNFEVCQEAKRLRRRKERKYRSVLAKSTDPVEILSHYRAFKSQEKETEKTLNRVREDYFCAKLEEVKDNPRAVWKTANHLLGRSRTTTVPGNVDEESVADAFMSAFKGKVDKIYRAMEKSQTGGPDSWSDSGLPTSRPPIFKFEKVSDEVLLATIKEMNTKHCALDPLPTSFIRKLSSELLPILSHIVNTSLLSGVFPSDLKTAFICPILKKADLDPDDLGNYRPVSNLPFLGKLIEKCAADQFVAHLENHNLLPSNQSAYRHKRSCETATLRILDDLLTLTDAKSKVILLLLDLSAAFDTVNHPVLLGRLRKLFGVSGTTLDWFESYLTGRTASVVLGELRSVLTEIAIGVPQGSILGPILFICYTAELEKIAARHGVSIHFYADDTQIYAAFSAENFCKVEERLSNCVSDIQSWLANNFLQLNPNKTEVLILSPRDKQPSITSLNLFRDSGPSAVTPSARNLGVYFDSRLKFDEHIDRVVRSCKATLINLWRVGGKLSRKLRTTLVSSLVHSKMDFCNSLLAGITKRNLDRLQKVQNASARFIYGQRRWRGTTKLRKQLHFLPIAERIEFKVCVLVFQCINGLAPDYLSDLLKKREKKVHSLRKDDDNLLLETAHSKYKSSEGAFHITGPKLWNQLPRALRETTSLTCFKKDLKTHLFRRAFSC